MHIINLFLNQIMGKKQNACDFFFLERPELVVNIKLVKMIFRYFLINPLTPIVTNLQHTFCIYIAVMVTYASPQCWFVDSKYMPRSLLQLSSVTYIQLMGSCVIVHVSYG